MYLVIKNLKSWSSLLEEIGTILFLNNNPLIICKGNNPEEHRVVQCEFSYTVMLRCLPTSTPEKHLRFTVQVHFIGPVPNHSKSFQRHSPHKTVCFGPSRVICFLYQIFLHYFAQRWASLNYPLY